jgi:hypothetical protein
MTYDKYGHWFPNEEDDQARLARVESVLGLVRDGYIQPQPEVLAPHWTRRGRGHPAGTRWKAEPDWAAVEREMTKDGLSLREMWKRYYPGAEYRGDDIYGYGYWCALYRAWKEGRARVKKLG